MAFTAKFESLDTATRDYLQAVRRRKGHRTPGVFAADGDALPWFGLVAGPFVGMLLFIFSFSGGKDAWATAMLQTAGVLIGGWPVWYAVRRWASGNSRWYGGRYKYFDPLHVYQVNGETVTVNGLHAVRGGEASGSVVRFDLDGRTLAVPVRSAAAAAAAEEYYAAMAELESRPDGKWAHVDAAELGAAAKYYAESNEEPRDISETGLEVDEVPTAPAGGGRAGWGFGGILLILLAGTGLFLAFWAVNVPLGDEIAFAQAKQGGAPGLRGYLLDPRNTSNRAEAEQMLARTYDSPVNRLKSLEPGQQPVLREGLIKLLDVLRTSTSPVVSIRVTEDGAPAGAETATQLRSELADGLARSIGPELIAFVTPPDDKPAHLTVTYKLPPPKANPLDDVPEVVLLTVEVRPKLDAEPSAATWRQVLKVNPGLIGIQRLDLLKQELSKELVGEWKPTPINLGSGDF